MGFWSKLFGMKARSWSHSDLDCYFGGESGHGGGSKTSNWFQKFGENPSLQGVVRRVSWDVAMIKWHVYRANPGVIGPNGPTLSMVTGHPLERLWNQPCPGLVGFQWRYLIQLYMELDGEAFLVVERRSKRSLEPKALWVIPSTWVEQRPTVQNPFWHVRIGSRVEVLPAGEVIWLHDPNPCDPYKRGLGVAKSVDDEVQQDEWMSKFNNSFFRQGGHPGQIFALEGVDSAVAKQVKEEYERKYSGFWNAFKTAWIGAPKGGSIKVHSLGANHKDMDFVQGKLSKRDSMIMAWNIPKFELGISEDVNRASAQASDYTKSKNVTLPRIVYLEEAFAAWLVPLFGDPLLRLVPEQVVKQTEEFRLAKSSEGWVSGALTRDEWRSENGFNPAKSGGEEYSPQSAAMTSAANRARLLRELAEIDHVIARNGHVN